MSLIPGATRVRLFVRSSVTYALSILRSPHPFTYLSAMAVAVQCGGILLQGMGKLLRAELNDVKVEDISLPVNTTVIPRFCDDPYWRHQQGYSPIHLTMEGECIPVHVGAPSKSKCTLQVRLLPRIKMFEAVSSLAKAVDMAPEDAVIFAGKSPAEALENMRREKVRIQLRNELGNQVDAGKISQADYEKQMRSSSATQAHRIEVVDEFREKPYIVVCPVDQFALSGGRVIDVAIHTLTGKKLKLTLDRHCSVTHVKSLIQDQEGIPPDQQRLVFEGKQMEQGCRLSDYDVVSGSTIHLVLRLCGGMYMYFSGRNGSFSAVAPPPLAKCPCAPTLHLQLAGGWKTTIPMSSYDPATTSVADLLEMAKELMWTREIPRESVQVKSQEVVGRKRPRREE